MNSEQDTIPNNEQLFAAIKDLQQQMIEQFNQMNKRFNDVDRRFEDMPLQMLSFDVRLDRMEAASYKVLEIAINTRADVKVLREEVHAWAKDVVDLQEKV